MAFTQISLASLIVSEFLFRKVPCIIKIISEEQKELRKYSKFFFIKEFTKNIIFNVEVLYYTGYITFSVLGKVSNDFYFSFLLLEIVMRFQTLKNVLMSISNPIRELLLTLTLWCIIIYYYTILSYTFFYNRIQQFPGENCLDECNNLLKCFTYLFYQNIKVF